MCPRLVGNSAHLPGAHHTNTTMRYIRIAVGLVLIGWAPVGLLVMLAWEAPTEFALAAGLGASILVGALILSKELDR